MSRLQNIPLDPARKANLMFTTQAGAIEGATQPIYLRPETAQGIFVNFANVHKTTRQHIPSASHR